MKRAIICAAVLAVLSLGLYFLLKDDGEKPDYKTAAASKSDIEETVTATGKVNAVVNVQVGTQVSGTVKTIFVDYNSEVKKGQMLAQIDPATFEAQVAQAQANLLSARAGLKKAQATLADNLRTLGRYKELKKKNFVSQSDVDTAQTNADTASAQFDASKAQIAQSQAALNIAQTNLGYTRILSPVDGTVISRSVDVGQTVAASFQTPTLFTIAQDLRKMQIDTDVDEADIGKIERQQEVYFNVDAYPDFEFRGSVFEVRNSPTTVQNVVTYDVIINVENPELKLKPGMTANVSIIINHRKGVLVVPNTALRFKLSEDTGKKNGSKRKKTVVKANGKGPSVWVLQKEKPVQVFIKTGISDGTNTEVVSGGLKEGMEVILEDVTESKKKAKEMGPGMFH
jgi:HlyD family secretion protein